MVEDSVSVQEMDALLRKAGEFLRAMEPRNPDKQADALVWVWRLLPANGWRVSWLLCKRALWNVNRDHEGVVGVRRHGQHEPYHAMARRELSYHHASRELDPARVVELREGCRLVRRRATLTTERAVVRGIPRDETQLEMARRAGVTPSGIRQTLKRFRLRLRKELPSLLGY